MSKLRRILSIEVFSSRHDWIIDILIVIGAALIIYSEVSVYLGQLLQYRTSGHLVGVIIWTILFAAVTAEIFWRWLSPLARHRHGSGHTPFA